MTVFSDIPLMQAWATAIGVAPSLTAGREEIALLRIIAQAYGAPVSLVRGMEEVELYQVIANQRGVPVSETRGRVELQTLPLIAGTYGKGPEAVGLSYLALLKLIGDNVTTAFSPTDIPGLKLWLDATQITGLVDNDPVTAWQDASGIGNNATQATPANQPVYKTNVVNGLPVVRGGASKLLVTSAPVTTVADNWSMFSVAYTRPTSNGAVHVSNGGGVSDGYGQTHVGGTGGFGMLYGGIAWVSSGVAETDQWIVETSIRTSGSLEVRKNGTLAATSAAVPNAPTIGTYICGNLGGSNNSDVAEVIIYEGALTNAQRDQVEAYLTARWLPKL